MLMINEHSDKRAIILVEVGEGEKYYILERL
jgi:hypothetical protein